jgi:hypothetical protein
LCCQPASHLSINNNNSQQQQVEKKKIPIETWLIAPLSSEVEGLPGWTLTERSIQPIWTSHLLYLFFFSIYALYISNTYFSGSNNSVRQLIFPLLKYLCVVMSGTGWCAPLFSIHYQQQAIDWIILLLLRRAYSLGWTRRRKKKIFFSRIFSPATPISKWIGGKELRQTKKKL